MFSHIINRKCVIIIKIASLKMQKSLNGSLYLTVLPFKSANRHTISDMKGRKRRQLRTKRDEVNNNGNVFVMFAGFPAAAYAAYAAGRGYSGYPSFGLPYPTGNHLSLNHLNHNAAHIAPLNLNLNLIQAQPAPHHNPPTPTPLFYHPNLDLYNAMPL